MGVRKNARFLTAAEREDFVRACVLLKADIVNPGAPPDQQYSRWDEFVAIHWEIQAGEAPGGIPVNFGHGGSGAYSFLSWHRFFLHQFELALQSKVPGVMLPYWDWTDPAGLMTDTFLGPDGTVGYQVRSGYFAADAPGTGTNPTPAPAWWPAGLPGWRLPSAFGTQSGPLRRALSAVSELPSATDLGQALGKTTYAEFQWAVEAGAGLTSGNQMHNDLHGWLGGPGQMSYPSVSPFDPFFYLHHCNIDRLWAMWQADGHATDYPSSGGKPQHHRNDLMYPWVGTTAGYDTTASIASAIPMPDVSSIGPQRNVDTLDYRAAYGYAYDSIAVIGLGLDQTGSMAGMTPDPMVTGAPDVTKWEAARRGVAAFLQDCETVQASGAVYTIAGVETFRRLASNSFTPAFGSPGYGLVKSGTGFSRAAFEAAAGALTPGGTTPLADALLDVQSTLVTPPLGGPVSGERRYLAMLTDGLLTAGAPLSSIATGALATTAVFAMGFGTDVDYVTLQTLVDKGTALATPQVFHGETAGTIDKFYSDALAAAIGFTSVFDPVVELFAGEYTHLEFYATSAEDMFLLTAQGMDFDDANWSFHLVGPDGAMVYGDMTARAMAGMGSAHAGRRPHVVARRAAGRLSLTLQRDSAADASWVGRWRLMVSYRAKIPEAMVMFTADSLLAPTQAGTLRGPRYARLLTSPKRRTAQRNVRHTSAHALDTLPPGANRNDGVACDIAVNVYARSRLTVRLAADAAAAVAGEAVAVRIHTDTTRGSASVTRAFARVVAPAVHPAELAARLTPRRVTADALRKGRAAPRFDPALALAKLEREDETLTARRDLAVAVVQHGGAPHLHLHDTAVPGPYHVAVLVEGTYCADHDATPEEHGHDGHDGHDGSGCGPDCRPQAFTRLLNLLVPLREK